MKKTVISISIALALLTVGCWTWLAWRAKTADSLLRDEPAAVAPQPSVNPDLPPQVIGGQVDEHGCLGPAGYGWDEEIGACLRPWEIKEADPRRAAKAAVDSVGQKVGLTVISVEAGDCAGCFDVSLENRRVQPEERRVIQLKAWRAVGEKHPTSI